MDYELFFLSGLGRSGTTWMMQLLNKKKEIMCKGEGMLVNGVGKSYPSLYDSIRSGLRNWYSFISLRKHNWIGLDDNITTINNRNFILDEEFYQKKVDDDISNITEYVIDYFAQRILHEKPSARLIGDKSPFTLAHDFAKLRKVFPSKKIIVLKRDLMRVYLSRAYTWYKYNISHPTKQRIDFPYFHEKDYIVADSFLKGESDSFVTEETSIKYAKIYASLYESVAKEQKKYPDLVKTILYEDLVFNTCSALSDVFDFLNVDYTYSEIEEIIESLSKEKLSSLELHVTEVDFSNWENYIPENIANAMREVEENEKSSTEKKVS